MCQSPIIINNHRSDYTYKLHRACVAVPCGVCDECIALKKTDIGIRAAFESERWFTAVMLCFTYNDEHQPYLVYDNQREFAVYMPHITELVSILRRHYQRRYVVIISAVDMESVPSPISLVPNMVSM